MTDEQKKKFESDLKELISDFMFDNDIERISFEYHRHHECYGSDACGTASELTIDGDYY